MKKFFSTIKSTKGFTLIELLIVVAIIGILTAIVMASLGSARGKAQAAKIKSEMASLRSQAELFATTTAGNVYTGFGASTGANGIATLKTAINTDANNSLIIGESANAWAASVTLPDGTFWCVDSNGASKSVTAAITTSTTVCP